MLGGVIGLLMLVGLIVVPLLWRVRQDRRAERALAIRAQAYAALVRALGGESLISLQAEAPTLWRPGRLVLSAPSDWQWLLAPAWNAVAAQVPIDYELVVTRRAPAAVMPPAEDFALRRAA
jgi:hypothetical protein